MYPVDVPTDGLVRLHLVYLNRSFVGFFFFNRFIYSKWCVRDKNDSFSKIVSVHTLNVANQNIIDFQKTLNSVLVVFDV